MLGGAGAAGRRSKSGATALIAGSVGAGAWRSRQSRRSTATSGRGGGVARPTAVAARPTAARVQPVATTGGSGRGQGGGDDGRSRARGDHQAAARAGGLGLRSPEAHRTARRAGIGGGDSGRRSRQRPGPAGRQPAGDSGGQLRRRLRRRPGFGGADVLGGGDGASGQAAAVRRRLRAAGGGGTGWIGLRVGSGGSPDGSARNGLGEQGGSGGGDSGQGGGSGSGSGGLRADRAARAVGGGDVRDLRPGSGCGGERVRIAQPRRNA